MRIDGRGEAVVVIGKEERWLRRCECRKVPLRRRGWEVDRAGKWWCREVGRSSTAGHGWPSDRTLTSSSVEDLQ